MGFRLEHKSLITGLWVGLVAATLASARAAGAVLGHRWVLAKSLDVVPEGESAAEGKFLWPADLRRPCEWHARVS